VRTPCAGHQWRCFTPCAWTATEARALGAQILWRVYPLH
jgi:hypothetical protein